LDGVAKKHDFCYIQQKIQQISDFAKKRDSNPPPHGDTAADIAKMFAKKISRKSDFGSKDTIFAIIRLDVCKIPRTLSQKLDSAKNFFFRFLRFFRYRTIFAKKLVLFWHNGKMSRDKTSRDKMSRDKMSLFKMSRDKMPFIPKCLLPKCLATKRLLYQNVFYTKMSPGENCSRLLAASR
jgi:hypothetical protein